MRPTVCYVAPYDPEYSRNTDTVRALRTAAARVEVVRGPVRMRSQSGRRRALWPVGEGLRQLLGLVWRAGDSALRLLRCRVLVVGYFGQFDMLLLAPIARALGRPVLFNPLVTLTDTVVEDRRLIAAGSLPARLIREIDRRALALADLVLVDTDENAAYIADLAGVPVARTLVFPVGVDETIFYPDDSAHGPEPDDLDVLFYGSFIPLHGAETIIRAAASLVESHPAIRFEMIGTGQEYASARKLASRIGAVNIRWTDWLPYSELGRRLREADVALGVFDGGGKAARVIPNKVHQALACGVPVVTRRSPAISRLLEDGSSAMLVSPDDPAALAAALIRLAGNPDLRASLGRQGRQAWTRHASSEQLVRRAGDALERLGIAR